MIIRRLTTSLRTRRATGVTVMKTATVIAETPRFPP
jgi:hypothetical protein